MDEPNNMMFYKNMPRIGVNARRLRGDDCRTRILDAIKAGIRCVDTAQAYNNEIEVGRAVHESGVARDELFVATKVHITDYRPYDLLWSVRESLDRLRLDHVDLLLLHGVNPNLGLKRTLEALQEARERGLTRKIGVADFSADLFRHAWNETDGEVCCNQIEYHPFLDRTAELAAAKECGVAVMAYAPLAMGAVNMSPTLLDISQEIGRSPSQVALRWLMQQQDNIIALPQPTHQSLMGELLEVSEFTLTDDHMQRISALTSENLTLCPTTIQPHAAA